MQLGTLAADIRHDWYMGENKKFESDDADKHILNEKKRQRINYTNTLRLVRPMQHNIKLHIFVVPLFWVSKLSL